MISVTLPLSVISRAIMIYIRADWHSSVSDPQTHLAGDVFIVSIQLPFFTVPKFTTLIVPTEQSINKKVLPMSTRLVRLRCSLRGQMIGSSLGRLCQSISFSFRRPFDSSSEGHRNSV